MHNNSRTNFTLPIPTNLGHNQIYIPFNTTPFNIFEIPLQNRLLASSFSKLVNVASKRPSTIKYDSTLLTFLSIFNSPLISLLCNQRLIFLRHRSFRSRGRFAVRRERLSGSSGRTYRNLSELVDDSISLPPRQLSTPALPRQFPRQLSTSVLHVCLDLTAWRFVGIYTRPSALK